MLLCLPWYIFVNKKRQYAAQKNLEITERSKVNQDIPIVVVTIFISLNKFSEGGEAILNISNKNHQKLIKGKVNASPLFI